MASVSLYPPPPINTQQPGVTTSLLFSGSQFQGHQKSKGNSYDVEVVLQVSNQTNDSHVYLTVFMHSIQLSLAIINELPLRDFAM